MISLHLYKLYESVEKDEKGAVSKWFHSRDKTKKNTKTKALTTEKEFLKRLDF